ncbi:MAG: hypothetical protein JNM35_16260, partial [Nitrospira sp.]|nr:hypothetical protein [Nitrospira sp.]
QRFGDPGAAETVLVSSGGGGKDLYEVRPHAHARRAVSAYHWGSVEVQGPRFQVRSHGLDGTELDRFEVPLPGAARLEALREIEKLAQ